MCKTVPLMGLLAALILVLTPVSSASAQNVLTLNGSIINQTENPDAALLAMPVRLTIISPTDDPIELQTTSHSDGSFMFKDIPSKINATYFVTVEHQGAVYSHSTTTEDVGRNTAIHIYDATDRTDALDIDSHSIIITGVEIQERFLEILERVALYNTSDRTMVANIGSETGKMPDLLRFALPDNATNIDLRSTLVGGEILEVDRGFAITTPIPPTGSNPHQFEFIYRLPYQTKTLNLSRVLRFGANTIRIVAPDTVGELKAPQLSYLGSTELNESMMNLFEGTDIPPNTNLELILTGIPQPSTLDWIQSRSGHLYAAVLVPASVVLLILLAILRIYTDRTKIIPAGFDKDLGARRTILLSSAASLNYYLEEKSISIRYYELEKQRIRAELIRIQIELDSQIPGGSRNR